MADFQNRETININRRVANLTPSQIESKRAIDRANQRYFRAKRKSYVEKLQKQVESLTRELESTRRELHECKDREKTLRDAFQKAFPTPSNQLTPVSHCASLASDDPFGAVSQDISSSPQHLDLSFIDNHLEPFHQLLPLDLGNGINVVNFSSSSQGLDPAGTDLDGQILFQPQSLAELPAIGNLGGAATNSYSLAGNSSSTDEKVPEWQQMPLHLPPEHQLEHVIIGTTETLRKRGLAERHNEDSVDSPFPSISSLLNSQPPETNTLNPISEAAAAQVGRSSTVSFSARIGFLYKLSHLLRWYICRTKDSYDRLPDFLKPTLLQKTVPHPAWVDVIVWPEARDAIIQQMDWSRFPEFRIVTGKTSSVNWHSEASSSLLESRDGKLYTLKPSFERHIRDLRNHSLGHEVAEQFPFMRPFCRPADE